MLCFYVGKIRHQRFAMENENQIEFFPTNFKCPETLQNYMYA